MTDTIITILIVVGCALFLGRKILRILKGQGDGCGCSGGCNSSKDSLCEGAKIQNLQHLDQIK